jgi:hypothetical protein
MSTMEMTSLMIGDEDEDEEEQEQERLLTPESLQSSPSPSIARDDSPTSPTSLSHSLLLFAQLMLLLFVWIVVANRSRFWRTEDRYDYDYTRPASINYNAIVRDLGLPKVFSQRFVAEPGLSLPPWCSYDTRHKTSVGSNKNAWPYRSGILYNKMPKAASSTTSGIVLRISNNVAARFSAEQRCTSYEHHIQTEGRVGRLFGDRDQNRSFLFSSVRDPAKQAVSHIFFGQISKKKFPANDTNMMLFLHDTNHQSGVISGGQGGFQVEYLTEARISRNSAWHHETPNQVIDPHSVHQYVRQILEDYDFLISVERFDESLVVMQLLLGLEAADILYVSSKRAGSSYTYNLYGRYCFFLHKPFVSERVAKYLASDEWYAKQYVDYVLKEAVRQSLDLTIDALGKDRFDQALETFLRLKEQASDECADKAAFPCSKEGVAQLELAKNSCYTRDWGCGYKCLDNLTAAAVNDNDNNRIL